MPLADAAAREQLIATALDSLVTRLELREHAPGPGSHTVIEIIGLEQLDVTAALGTYLTGLVAGAVTVDLGLTARYLGEDLDDLTQLAAEVDRAVGSSNLITQGFRENRRNPWISECLAHLLLMLAGDGPGVCVPGRVWGATLPHDKVTQQGLDLVAVFDDAGMPALCIGESKASANWAANHLNSSIRLFREIDGRQRDQQIRTVVISSLESSLPEEIRDAVPGMFWRDRRLYLPLIGFSKASSFDPHAERPDTFGELLVAADRRRCVGVGLDDFDLFFDCVADAMRCAVTLMDAN